MPNDPARPTASGRIFISYRREETAYAAGWLYDRLDDHFGNAQVFKGRRLDRAGRRLRRGDHERRLFV